VELKAFNGEQDVEVRLLVFVVLLINKKDYGWLLLVVRVWT
jgi:hypothetical protein